MPTLTFLTEIENVSFANGHFAGRYRKSTGITDTRKKVYGNSAKILLWILPLCHERDEKNSRLDDLDESDEINACSIVVDVDIDGKKEPYLVMFKNETHNHQRKQPFGGAATCLGGAIRPCRAFFVYQA